MKSKERILTLLFAVCILLGMISETVLATERDDNNNAHPVEEWEYAPNKTLDQSTSTFSTDAALEGSEQSADIVVVNVTAMDRRSGKMVSVAEAEVNLYVGSNLMSTTVSDDDGIARVSLSGLTIEQRRKATISANKVVSRGKGINGSARDKLFEYFPKDENNEYYRYTMELHSETIDRNGNWIGAKIPTSYESGKVDIVFVIDATGSMSDEINNVKDNVASFSENLINRGLDIRFCIIDYRDITEKEKTTVHENAGTHWLTNIDGVVNELGKIGANGGGDTPETVLDPLGYVADDALMNWRSDAYRFGFVLTDADYKTDNSYGYSSLAEVAEKLAEMRVVTSVITSTDYQSTYSELYKTTGGIYADINSSTFDKEMLTLSNSIISSVTREMTLTLHEPRMLVNLSVCYYADDSKSQSESYKKSVKTMLNEYSNRLAESTDGHILIDKILLFSTSNRLNFYTTTSIASMADIRIETEEDDDGKLWFNVKIHSNAHVTGFYTDSTYTAVYDGENTEFFSKLKDGEKLNGRRSFYRIQMSGVEGAGWNNSMIDDAYAYSTTVMHETGHYLLGFFDEYLDAEKNSWGARKKPYKAYGLMDNQHEDIEMSKAAIDYAYMTDGFAKANFDQHTYQSYRNGGACEDSLATLLTNPAFSSYYFKHIIGGSDFALGVYKGTYSKAKVDRTATYSYATLSAGDFLSLSGVGGRSLTGYPEGMETEDSKYTTDCVANVAFESGENAVVATISGEEGVNYTISSKKAGDEEYIDAALADGRAKLPIAKGEVAEVRVTATKGNDVKHNTYYIDRSGNTETGYMYTAADNAVMAYVTTNQLSSYTFIADNTQYTNGEYFSVNQATLISSDNGSGFVGGEIYSVANHLAEIDYTTLAWFKYVGGEWTILETDYTEEENMNIGARADLSGEGIYVLMAKMASASSALPAENLSYTQSTDRDAVVTVNFDDPNTDSIYYNVFYSNNKFADKTADSVVVRSFSADDTALTINLLERGRTVYAAVEIVLADGSRSALSEIILIGGEADSDGDGIPDWFCDKYHLWGEEGEDKDIANSDDDGDGLTNLEEYHGGSDPTNPNDPVHTTNIPVDSVGLNTEQSSLHVGQMAEVTAIVLPENATNKAVTWKVENTDVASVKAANGTCVITAVAIGKTNVYVVTNDGGYSATVSVIVSDTMQYTISATAGRNGTLAPSGKVAVFEGENKTFEIKPDAGYRIKNVEVNGRSVGPVNSYTFTDVRNDATIFATFEKETNTGITDSGTTTTAKDARQTQFDDVHSTDYYYDAVLWAVDKGITTGVSANRFEPNSICTRAQAVAFLWRASGSPAPKNSRMPFTDVSPSAYYYDAVLWALEEGITTGTASTTFSPDAVIDRAQAVTLLHRANGAPSVTGRTVFTDVPQTTYYADAVKWAVDHEITTGTSAAAFSPNASCTRAQIVTFLYRAYRG